MNLNLWNGEAGRQFAPVILLGVMGLSLLALLVWRSQRWSLVKRLRVLNWMLALTVVTQLSSAAFQIRNHVRRAESQRSTTEIVLKSKSQSLTVGLPRDSLQSHPASMTLSPDASAPQPVQNALPLSWLLQPVCDESHQPSPDTQDWLGICQPVSFATRLSKNLSTNRSYTQTPNTPHEPRGANH